ncbi:medium-chain acyl-CoA ligase ACSF2, mitochondrial-like isoform X2 [Sitophilus oryzae]|nr:medium-chain acyl-CoA ligase ACSF2, mitochondrial-like isoform X2 [Sitophilus oryzae]
MACARGGYILVNINSAYQPSELEYCINKVGVKCIISDYKFKTQNYYDFLNEISPEISTSEPGKLKCTRMPTLENIIVITEEDLRGAFKFQEILDLATDSRVKNAYALQDSIDPDQPCHIQFTSGTTGQPKAAIQSHFHLVNNSFFLGKRNELDRKQHSICVQVPFFHAFGTDITICAALNHGATLVVPSPGYDPDKSLDAIRDEKCSVIHGTPTMYVDLINRQKVRKEDISPEIAVCGGASCSPHLFRQMSELLKVKKVKSIYGLTEATAVIFQSLYDDNEYQSTSTVGYIGDHLEAKVINEEGKIVPRGVPGELCIRGYCTTLGYWDDEDKTKELISSDKWLRTGDQFVIEENGYGKVVGRLKELIIRGGENIFPREIEDLLNTHPDILESHVIGLPHERLGEEICACVRTTGTSLSLEEIKAYCKGKVAYFKIPSILKIVESFPKTTSGKIQKYKLVNLFKDRK